MVELLEKMKFTQHTGKVLLSLGLWGHSDIQGMILVLKSPQSSNESPTEVYTTVLMHTQQLILVWREQRQEGHSRRLGGRGRQQAG